MKKFLPFIVILSTSAQASKGLCYQKGAEAPHLFNQEMAETVYEIKVIDNGNEDPAEVTITVPPNYKSVLIMGITVKLGGYNDFTADLLTATKDSKVYSGFYVAKSDLPKVSILANYQTTELCEGIEITKEFISYNVPISHNNLNQQGPAAGTR